MFLKANALAFERCTSSSTTAELSKREQACIRSVLSAYLEARTLANHSS
jgi:hypothetical protein